MKRLNGELTNTAKIHPIDDVSNFTWVVQLYDFDLDYSNKFFFWVNPDGPNGFTSGFFNISRSSTAPTTATTDATSTPTPALPSTSSDASDSEQSSSLAETSSGLTSTEKIALGVGIGVGVPVLTLLAALVWLIARRPRNNGQMQAVPGPSPVVWPTKQHPSTPPKELHATVPTVELPS